MAKRLTRHGPQHIQCTHPGRIQVGHERFRVQAERREVAKKDLDERARLHAGSNERWRRDVSSPPHPQTAVGDTHSCLLPCRVGDLTSERALKRGAQKLVIRGQGLITSACASRP